MKSAVEELTSITHILHATIHRNKNQHRLTHWWKHLNILRRNVHKLVLELENLARDEKYAGSAGGMWVEGSRARVEERVEFIREWVVPGAYLAFSTVVADGQYATLGMMLVGMLARIRTIILPLGKEEEVKENAEVKGGGNLEGIDLGEVIRREDVTAGNGKESKTKTLKTDKKKVNATVARNEEPASVELNSRQRRKKRRKDESAS